MISIILDGSKIEIKPAVLVGNNKNKLDFYHFYSKENSNENNHNRYQNEIKKVRQVKSVMGLVDS